jgi:hypothetical protein
MTLSILFVLSWALGLMSLFLPQNVRGTCRSIGFMFPICTAVTMLIMYLGPASWLAWMIAVVALSVEGSKGLLSGYP